MVHDNEELHAGYVLKWHAMGKEDIGRRVQHMLCPTGLAGYVDLPSLIHLAEPAPGEPLRPYSIVHP
jgi:hypothetical protein